MPEGQGEVIRLFMRLSLSRAYGPSAISITDLCSLLTLEGYTDSDIRLQFANRILAMDAAFMSWSSENADAEPSSSN